MFKCVSIPPGQFPVPLVGVSLNYYRSSFSVDLVPIAKNIVDKYIHCD